MNREEQAIEIIRLNVAPEMLETFLQQRKEVDEAVAIIDGFINAELCQLTSTDWVAFVRWSDETAMKAAQQITQQLPVITAWIGTAEKFISFETAIVKTSYK